MEVNAGFRWTEAGTLPEEWDARPLSEISEKIMVGIASAATHAYRPKGIPMFRNQDIKAGHLSTDDLLFIDESYEATYKNKRLRGGDLLTMRTGYPGLTTVVPDQYDQAQSFTTLITRPNQKIVESKFLCHYMNSEGGRRFFSNSQIGGAQKNVNVGTLQKMPIPLPPPKEQRAISNALSDVDALIVGLEKLIAKKRDIKQAAMQQLLTGQSRLPGFRGKWEVKRLGEHFVVLKNGVNSRAELLGQGTVRYLHYGDIHGSQTVTLIPLKASMPFLPPPKASRLDRLMDGDLVFSDASEDLDGVGKSIEISQTSGLEVVSGMHTIAVRFDKKVLADGFKAYLQFIPTFRDHLKRLAAGTKVYATNRAHIASAELLLPDANEQRAIANVLSDMDSELEALESRLTKTRAIKQGMMQELLTGRTRLI